MVLGGPWQVNFVLFFNVMQLVIVVYAILVLVFRVTNLLKVDLWKLENITAMVLGSLEFAATTACAVNVPNSTVTDTNPIAKAIFSVINTHVNIAAVGINVTAMTSMVVSSFQVNVIHTVHCQSHYYSSFVSRYLVI